MKDYIVILEASELTDKVQIVTVFDTFEEAENQMTALVESKFFTYADASHPATVKLKQQNHNLWWTWDKETGQGWLPVENEAVRKSRERLETVVAKNVRFHICIAAKYEEPYPPDHPAGRVDKEIRNAYAKIHRAKATLLSAEAELAHFRVVLEAHGNVEWPL